MRELFIDFETYYDRDYSLRKMNYIEYIRDPRFQVLGVALAFDDEPADYLTPKDFSALVRQIDWPDTKVIAHNTLFDGFILTDRYGVDPGAYFCTQALSRAVLPIPKHSLMEVSAVLGIGRKGSALVEGSRDGAALRDYAIKDMELCRGIYRAVSGMLPPKEHQIMSMVLRWGVKPLLELDLPRLQKAYEAAVAEREATIAASGATEAELGSNPKFAALLRSLGIEVPTKISLTTGEETEAFAKGDPEFQEMMASYPEHAPLWKGRLAAKSTIGTSRPLKFMRVARHGKNTMPMPLNYSGAHTHRLSGAASLNVQNLENGSETRKSLIAPDGHVILAIDSSQIELRVNLWFAGQTDQLAILASGDDIYKATAGAIYGKPPDEVTKQERQVGKVVALGCGYGMGSERLQATFAAGVMRMPPMHMDLSTTQRIIQAYRALNYRVVSLWGTLGQIVSCMTRATYEERLHPVTFGPEHVLLPNGMFLQYPNLTVDYNGQATYGHGKVIKRLYGGSLDENIVQALARIIVMEQILAIDAKYPSVSSTHDEGMFLVPEAEAEEAMAWGLEVFSTPPSWAPDLPLSAEAGYAKEYSK